LFVPVREIFEALGAHVHAHASEITATTLGAAGAPPPHTIVMHVGDPDASIDGSDATLLYPPALIDGAVYVPLRFVATALGATVRYDALSHTIFITRAAAVAPPQTPTPTPTREPVAPPVATAEPSVAEPVTPTPIALPTAAIVLRVVREEPARGTTVARERPEISASFGEPVAAASVRVLLDGHEITRETTKPFSTAGPSIRPKVRSITISRASNRRAVFR
jgi:hypothetical protein